MKSINFNLSNFLLVFLILFFFFTGISYHKGVSLLFLPEISWMITLWAFVLTTLTGWFTNNLRKLLRPGKRDCAIFATKLLAFWVIFAGGGHQAQAQSCNCKEFIYVNEVTAASGGRVHKFEVNGGSGSITEIMNGGGAWYPGSGTSQMPFPHGLGTDRNGYLYIGSSAFAPNNIRRLDCAGNITPTGTFSIPNVNDLFNIDSYDGVIYSNGDGGRIYKWNPCTGAQIGYVQLGNGATDWGFSIDNNGKFYVTNQVGKAWIFTPTAADFTANTTFFETIDLFGNPTQGGALSPAYSGTGLNGITSDDAGNIYIVEGNRDVLNTPSRLLKFTAAGVFVAASVIDANGTDGTGWNQMAGIVYSSTANRLYTTSINAGQDCVYRWRTDLSPDGAAIGPVPGIGMSKGIAILSECCPTSATVNVASCGASITDRVSLSDLLACDGVICDGQWALQPGSTNFTYNSCDVTGTPSAFPACATFSLSNSGVTNAPCAPYTVTVNVSLLADVTAQTIAGNQTVCPTDNPAAFTVTTPATVNPPGATITYQWQQSTTSCTAGFTDISGANNATYDPGPVSVTTYFRVIARITGCTAGVCEDISNCVTLTIGSGCAPVCTTPTATAAAINATCSGNTANSNGRITVGSFAAGQRYQYSAGATFNSGVATPATITAIPVGGVITSTLPNTTQQYTVRIYDAVDNTCFVDRVVSITFVDCSSSTTSCNCKEYVYLNEPDLPGILKFELNPATVPLIEVIGSNGLPHWYPGSGVSTLPSPHGLGTDLNGRLYIAENGFNGNIRQFNCDGELSPIGPSTIFNPGVHQNIFSIDNILFANTHGGPTAFNTCTGQVIGQVCFNDAAGNPMPLTGPNLWGLSYNSVTEMVYATSRTSPQQPAAWRNLVWAFSRAQLEAALANGTCIDPFIVMGGSSTVNPGDNFTPQTFGPLMGITSDNAGNMYIVKSILAGGANLPGALAEGNYIMKYNAQGNYVGQTPPSFAGDAAYAGIGLVWSETTNRLYVSNFTDDAATDCISAFNANTLQYAGTAAPNPNLPSNNQAKAIAILKECCPVGVPANFSKNVCGGIGTKYYLNREAFSTCDGVVCSSTWVPQGALNGMTFDPCDNSVTITGVGCGTFTLNIGAVGSTGCAAQSSTFSICSTLAPDLSNPSGPQSVCEGNSGNNITVNSSQNTTNCVRFVRFTADQMAGATPTALEAATIYAGTAVATVTPTGSSVPYMATLTAATAGWGTMLPGTYYIYAIANPDFGASCRPVQEIVVTIVDKPEVAVSSGAICAGSFINLNNLVTTNSPAGALSFHTTLADANAGTNPLVNAVVLPSATTTYYVRSAANATCYSVGALSVTVSTPPVLNMVNGQVCAGNSLNLATLVTNSGGGTLSYFTTLTNSQNNINALASPVVAPTSATNYFIRSTNAAGCYTIQNVVVSLAAANCGAIQVSGPN